MAASDDRPHDTLALVVRRDRARKRLRALLNIADDASFCAMVWSLEALKMGSRLARRNLQIPASIPAEEIARRYTDHAHDWALETLLNELFVTPKRPLKGNQQSVRALDCRQVSTAARVLNALRELEDAEDGLWLARHHIKTAMRHIAHRQFPWQRGFANISELHKYAMIFNFPEADAYFQTRHKVSVNDFSHCCFALFVHAAEHPLTPATIDLRPAGITHEARDATLETVSASIVRVRAAAQRMRGAGDRIAYKPSVLRLLPGVRFDTGPNARTIFPIRDLIIHRATAGLYYDLVDASDQIRNLACCRFGSSVLRAGGGSAINFSPRGTGENGWNSVLLFGAPRWFPSCLH